MLVDSLTPKNIFCHACVLFMLQRQIIKIKMFLCCPAFIHRQFFENVFFVFFLFKTTFISVLLFDFLFQGKALPLPLLVQKHKKTCLFQLRFICRCYPGVVQLKCWQSQTKYNGNRHAFL